MPSFAIPPKDARTIVIDTLERTSAASSTMAFRGEAAKLRRSGQVSQYLLRRLSLDAWIQALPKLSQVPANWNSYGAPPPNAKSVISAAAILKRLNPAKLMPDVIRASAEGGVAILFTGADRNRAIIETLNDGEEFILIYDLDGKNKTLNWPVDLDEQGNVLKILTGHLEGTANAIGNL